MYILESYPFYVFNALIYSFLCFLFLKKVIQKIYFYSFYMHGSFSKMEIA